jgi:ribonuclease P protein component
LFITLKATFKKTERLCDRKLITALYTEGKTLFNHPFKLQWQEITLDTPIPVQVVIAVPKRHFKKAIQRNRLKRQMREAYRKNKHLLYEYALENRQQFAWMLVYIAKEPEKFAIIEAKLIQLIQRFIDDQKNNHLAGNSPNQSV